MYRVYYFFIKLIVNIAFTISFRFKVEGMENIPKNETFIYVSNHRTNADPPLVLCRCRGLFAIMAKEELFRNKLFAKLIRSLGAYPVSRGKGDTTVIDTALEKLEKGSNFLIFPEGTRSKDGKVHRGHSGAAVISARSGKRIIPVGVVFGDKLKFRTKVTVKYGKPIAPSEYIDDFTNPNPRQLVKLKNRYMDEIKLLVEGESESKENKNE